MKQLLRAGADPNLGDARGTTPLMHAATYNLTRAALTLLQHEDVDPSVQDGDGNSALMFAAAHGHREALLLVLAAFRSVPPRDLPRSSHRRARASANPLSRGGPTDPLPPPAFLAFGQTASSAAPYTSDTDEEEAPPARSLRLLTATPTEDFLPNSRQASVWGPGGGGAQLNSSDSDESRDSGSSYRSVGGARPPSPVHVPSPDEEERRMLDRLMTGSPGSGNEGDTESLMEVDRAMAATMAMTAGEEGGQRGATAARKLGVTSPAAAMPRLAGSRSLNRSIAQLAHEDSQQRPDQRPPTPARPSLPTLLPARLLDAPLAASLGSSRGEARPAQRRITLASFPRSSSEPRSLVGSAGPATPSGPEEIFDGLPLDASTRSEGWEALKGPRGRPSPLAQATDGHVVPLPPINRPRYMEACGRGRTSGRGRSLGGDDGGDTVLSVAKKTLEQLETVLAPHEGPAAPRPPHRTRPSHQIHLET
ncbi:ankyrin repeat domain-containing protein 34A-like [Scylla paramamosain]|uniref:ankyrin repeat domain-containing protein 34A-like n=1 Tax=Scylla paramamosain TaxID=85552 RepID=UPI003083117F